MRGERQGSCGRAGGRPGDGCPRQDSNLRTRLRRAVLYPLSYGGSVWWGDEKTTSRPALRRRRDQGAGSGWPPRAVSIPAIVVVSTCWVSAIDRASVRTAGTSACVAAYDAMSEPP